MLGQTLLKILRKKAVAAPLQMGGQLAQGEGHRVHTQPVPAAAAYAVPLHCSICEYCCMHYVTSLIPL